MLVLAIILNPRAKRDAQRGEQKSRNDVRDDGGSSGGGTAMGVMHTSGVQDNK